MGVFSGFHAHFFPLLKHCATRTHEVWDRLYLADDSGLGFFGGAALIGGLLVLVATAAFFTRLNRTLLFWITFVLTRPFCATFGDLLTKPMKSGGMGFGTAGSSEILAGLLVVLVIYTQRLASRDVGGLRSSDLD